MRLMNGYVEDGYKVPIKVKIAVARWTEINSIKKSRMGWGTHPGEEMREN